MSALRRRALPLIATLTLAAVIALPGLASATGLAVEVISRLAVAEGIAYTKYRIPAPSGVCHVVDIAPATPVRLLAAVPGDGAGTSVLSAMCSAQRAVVGVNGAFFTSILAANPAPLGWVVQRGRVVSRTQPVGPAVGVAQNGRYAVGAFDPPAVLHVNGRHAPFSMELTAVNAPVGGRSAAALYTETHVGADLARGGTCIWLSEVAAGDYTVCARAVADSCLVLSGSMARLASRFAKGDVVEFPRPRQGAWGTPPDLLSGGPQLMRAGAPVPDPARAFEGLAGRNPRTIVGTSAAGHLLLLVVEGRLGEEAEGLTASESTRLCVTLGFHNALMMDGGDSSELWIAGHVANRLSGRTERPLPSALLFVPR